MPDYTAADADARLDRIKAKVTADKAAKPAAKTTTKAAPQYGKGRGPGAMFGSAGPYVTSGRVGEQGYSFVRAAGFALGLIPADEAKEEIEAGLRLKAMYVDRGGYQPHYQGRSFLVPAGSDLLLPVARGSDRDEKFVGELKQKMAASYAGGDPDEARWMVRKGLATKAAMSTLDETAGGVLTGFPTLGELIDLQRNMEAFAQAGAQQITLPGNARISFPKLSGGSTAYWVGEGANVTESSQNTGRLNLEGHKLGILVKVNNELFRYANPTAEAMIRGDMARVAALKADLAQLEGTGGTQPKGLITYETQTSWSTGSDKLIAYTSVDTPADANTGYTFQPEDVARIEGKLPDEVEATAWVMRKDFHAAIMNRRADTVTPGDGKGLFMFMANRDPSAGPSMQLYGTKVCRTSQVSNARTRGTAADLTYLLYGNFKDWITARLGVLEFLANPYGDTAFVADQTWLRAIETIDGGPRHAASFVLCDQLRVA